MALVPAPHYLPGVGLRCLDMARNQFSQMRCPECNSENFVTAAYDHGVDPETGYHNAGVRACCLDCGHEADVEDFQERANEQKH